MSEGKDQLIERLTQRARHELADESGHVNGYTPEEIARWSLRAMRAEDDGLEALLERHNVTDVHVVRLRMDDNAPVWRAFLSRDFIVSAERMWSGEAPTRDGAIRAAVESALREGE